MYEYVPGLYDVRNGYVLVRTRKNKNSITHKVGIRTEDLMQSILCTMPLRYQRYSMVTSGDNRRYIHTVVSHGTFGLVPDVLRGSRRAPSPGHDVTGPDIDLNFPDTQFRCGAGLRMSDVAMDRRPTEKQAPAGELAGFTALGTHEPSSGPAQHQT